MCNVIYSLVCSKICICVYIVEMRVKFQMSDNIKSTINNNHRRSRSTLRFIQIHYDKRLVFLPFPRETRTEGFRRLLNTYSNTMIIFVLATRALSHTVYSRLASRSREANGNRPSPTYTVSLIRRHRSGYFCPSIAQIPRFSRATLYFAHGLK